MPPTGTEESADLLPRVPSAAADGWLWSTRSGSLVSWGILLAVFGSVWAVKWGGLRAPGLISWEPGRWVLGWAPSFLAGLGLPFLWPAIRRRLGQRRDSERGWIMRVDFLPECMLAFFVLAAGELMDWLVPGAPRTAVQTFAVSDVVAIVAGNTAALALYRLLAGSLSATAGSAREGKDSDG